MKSIIYSLGLVVLFLLPGVALSQGYINWPATEDTIMVPGGTILNVFIGSDTAGTGPQLEAGRTAWLNRTRVYVLRAGQKYAWNAACSLSVAGRSLYIRGENGKDYTIPSTITSIQRPILRSITSPLTTAWFILNADDLVFGMKNVVWTAYDEVENPTHLRTATGTFINCTVNARPSIYLDSCIFTGELSLMQYAGRSISPLTTGGKTIRIQNCIIGDNGTLVRSNFGAGRVVDLRTAGVDTLDMSNNTIFNVVDRVIRYLGATKPIFSLKFNHNTVQNCISYHGFVALGWIDSLGNGPFEIKNNLLVDVSAFGADTDQARQLEFSDNPDVDINGLKAFSYFICRANNSGHVTPWDISNNYYCVSDSGAAIRDFETGPGLHHVVYPSTAPERILTSDMVTQLIANGGNANTAFTKVKINFNNATKFPSKLARWYFSPYAAGYVPTTATQAAYDSCVGAGEGKRKYATAPMPNFAALLQFTDAVYQYYQYPYDYHRMTVDSIYNWLDCGFNANIDLSHAASDGGVVGSKMWSFGSVSVPNDFTSNMPNKFNLDQNYPNPFNPTTTIQYSIPTASHVTLKIVNILGQVVATLVDEKQEAKSYTKEFDASRLSSGVYFYQINAGTFSATKKMILMK